MSETLPNNLQKLTALVGDDRNFVLRIVQPGLAGLMDGSVSTLAPIFATASATHNSHMVFVIGRLLRRARGSRWRFRRGRPTTAS